MKFEWEPCDIRPGRRMRAASATEQWMLGYDASKSDKDAYWCVVSLSDGMISQKDLTTYQVADFLNSAALRPVDII